MPHIEKAQEGPREDKGNKKKLEVREHSFGGSDWEYKSSGPPKGVTNVYCEEMMQ